MKPTIDHCRAQVIRLSGLPNFPNREGVNELVLGLMRHAMSNEHAERIITAALDTSKWAPTPADLRQISLDTRDDFLPKVRAGCRKCNGTGYNIGLYLVTWSTDHKHRTSEPITPEQAAVLRPKLTRTQDITEAAARCDCLEEIIANMPPEPPPKRSSNRSGRMRQADDVGMGAL